MNRLALAVVLLAATACGAPPPAPADAPSPAADAGSQRCVDLCADPTMDAGWYCEPANGLWNCRCSELDAEGGVIECNRL